MGKNINQIATAATSIVATDKLYLGRSPFGATDDRYILGSSIISQFLVSANASTGVILRSNGANFVASTATFADTYAASTLLYASSINTVSGLATNTSSVLVTNSTGVPTWVQMINGQTLIGSTGATPSANFIGVSGNLSTGTGPTTFTISTEGMANYSFVDETTTSRTLTPFQCMVADNAGVVTGTIPASSNFGDVFEIVGKGTGGWKLQANAGQTINLGSSPTTVAGSLASTNQYDAIQVVCVTSNTTFVARSVIGNITVA